MMVTWNELITLEPELARLYRTAQNADPGEGSFCSVRVYYLDFKPAILKIVGFERRQDDNPILCSSEAYNMATRMISECMPPCRDCGHTD